MTATARPAALKSPIPLYTVGLFSMGYVDFYIFLMPLYCLSLGMSASEVGMIVGARSALAVFLSIHVGVLMDRFGTRRVTLFSCGAGFVWRRCFRSCRGSGRSCCCRLSMAVPCPSPGRVRRR